MDDQFSAYEVDPGDAGYEDGGYEDDGYEDESYDPYELAEALGIVDAYGDVDEERLADVVGGMHHVHQNQVSLAQAQSDHALDQTARDLERDHPQLRDNAGVQGMLDAAAEIVGYQGDPHDLLEYTVANPELVEDAIELMNGEGIFQRLWAEQNADPGLQFWGGGGSGFGGM